jgi:cell wall-associated NlpC family hydrolase
VLIGLVLMFGGVLLVRGAVKGDHPLNPVLEAMGAPPLDPPGSGGATSMGGVAFGTGQAFGTALKDAGANTVGATVVQAAQADLGLGYLFGHIGPPAEDCSGLVVRAYGAAGIPLIHNAAAMFTQCRRIRKADAVPGDLVFEPLGETSINHVVIWLGGNTVIESAPSHGGVGITPLTYQRGPYLFARPIAAFPKRKAA